MDGLVLGISAYYHDSAAVLLDRGEILAAAHEERFTRKKHDAAFPVNAVKYVLAEAGARIDDLDAVAFYDKPYLKFERLLETYHAFAPRGLRSFLASIPVWINEKLFMRKMLWEGLAQAGGPIANRPPLLFPEHHLSHAASAFYASPFSEAAVLTIDGVGEWATTTISAADSGGITVLKELCFPHSVGLLYSAFTCYCGFRVNSGEYKLMGLAPYGHADSEACRRYQRLITDHLVDIRDDGSILLNLDYFDYATGLRMCRDGKWRTLFGLPRRMPESGDLSQPYMDLALAVQRVTETIVLRLAKTARELTGRRSLVMAGGVALNCVANGRLVKEQMFDDLWIQPAAGDAGGALGAAYAAWHIWGGHEHQPDQTGADRMRGSYLGPEFHEFSIRRMARRHDAVFDYYPDFEDICRHTADLIAAGRVVGWFQGRMEWGPRALGNRSIVGDPRLAGMQKKLNLKIKYREGFRPFAPSVLDEDAGDYFDLDRPSPYMLLVAPVREKHRRPLPDGYDQLSLYERLYHQRSDIPAVTHVDFSARVQTVHQATNEKYWRLIRAFKDRTGCGLVVNTSFNVRGEPIVCTPEDAYRCFMRTEMDALVIENFIFDKKRQPEFSDPADRCLEFQPD